MVLLKITPKIKSALDVYERCRADDATVPLDSFPPSSCEVGEPISHTQLIELAKYLKRHPKCQSDSADYHLDSLLCGTSVYVPPPKALVQTPEYHALMDRLRAEEERRKYMTMTASIHSPSHFMDFRTIANEDDEEETLKEIQRQISMIMNVVFSVLGTAGAVWVMARYKDAPIRIALSMGSGILVAIAEAVIYSGFFRAQQKGRAQGGKIGIQNGVATDRHPNTAHSAPVSSPSPPSSSVMIESHRGQDNSRSCPSESKG